MDFSGSLLPSEATQSMGKGSSDIINIDHNFWELVQCVSFTKHYSFLDVEYFDEMKVTFSHWNIFCDLSALYAPVEA